MFGQEQELSRVAVHEHVERPPEMRRRAAVLQFGGFGEALEEDKNDRDCDQKAGDENLPQAAAQL
jgi:hypothetical protein